MHETRETLLARLRDDRDAFAWAEFDALYRPFLARWYRRRGVSHADADDLVQEALIRVRRGLPDFQRQRLGSFRRWLRTIAGRVQASWARQSRPGALSPADQDDLVEAESDAAWDREHDTHVVNQLLDRVRGDFEPVTFEAFRMVALEQVPPDQVAAEHGLTVVAVYAARARVLKRLREEAGGLLD